jgi:hypothetical protein
MANTVVTAPLVIIKNEDGSDRYLYRGAVLPEHVKGDALQRLKDDGFVGSEADLASSANDPLQHGTGANTALASDRPAAKTAASDKK